MPPKKKGPPGLTALAVADSDKGATGGDLRPMDEFHAADGKFEEGDVTVDGKGTTVCLFFSQRPLSWL
jgi:hypothetical protein